MARLTEPRIQALLREAKPVVVAVGDGSGLCFCITDGGTATWKLRYRHSGKPHWLTLGRYSEQMGLKKAKEAATKERAKLIAGIDPVAQRRAAKLDLKAAKTFAELTEDYMAVAGPDLAKSTRSDRESLLKRDILPRIGQRRTEDIPSAEIRDLIKQIGRRSASMGRRAFAVISVIFEHGLATDLAKANPCIGLKPRAILGKAKPVRETRALTEDELQRGDLKGQMQRTAPAAGVKRR